MSDIGLIGSPGAFKANLLNLRQTPAEGVDPLVDAKAGLPWQKAGQTVGYKAPHPGFERVLLEMMVPDETMTPPVNAQPPAKKQEKAELKSEVEQAVKSGVDAGQRGVQQPTNPFFFNYIAQPLNGHYRTELARNAYNAMGRAT